MQTRDTPYHNGNRFAEQKDIDQKDRFEFRL